ncbi:hypothetical protein SAMD00019534_022850 [Acytostelium subglobosum LB1]|uniref:hypothetical protein n=1 Tax=Acytostelium subglobosum LB1 TaxID=1410327 RepID=UPI000644DA22|nr:hypothetical protein SAMD00019534_022850 [Acytostelium subglobosum LB1]GAM19110.1 hypothetical protein SAMD00019534_022850 [Acytostelium subglobosum LB1]|eukprot:XP_012757037.1 hypothetical protein SAMD00019534_022850 [Acytostelium subglobosum LB1]
MRYSIVLLSLVAIIAATVVPMISAACINNNLVRKEIRQLTPAELTKYINAVTLARRALPRPGPTQYDTFARIHAMQGYFIHSGANFLPWHRYYLRQYELLLQSVINDPTLTVPYWDWTLDYQNPSASVIFTDPYFGGNGGSASCVTNGKLGQWRPLYNWAGNASAHCLKRSFGEGMSRYPSPATLQTLISGSATYANLATNIEIGPHNLVHSSIGGDMKEAISPNDALFFSHHANVDRLWANWQDANPTLAGTYNGKNITGQRVGLTDILHGFPGITVSKVMKASTMGYCYSATTASAAARSAQTLDDESEEPLPNWPPVSAEFMASKGIDPKVQAEVTARINNIIDALNDANGF